MNEKKILLVGFQRCGNTHARFVIFNYWNILENNVKKTLTYNELIRINNEIWKGIGEQYPQVYFAHTPKNGKKLFGYKKNKKTRLFDNVDDIIYVIRNPFDCMISYFHYMINRDLPFNGYFVGKELEDVCNLGGFVRKFLPLYINHVKTTKHLANVVLDYDVLRKYPEGFGQAIELVFGNIDVRILSQAIDYSSFDSIKQMGIDTGKPGGLASDFRDNFTRDGRVGQYLTVMSEELIDYIKIECKKEGLKV